MEATSSKSADTSAGLVERYAERKSFRKEKRIAEILARRGTQPGWVHVFSAMENCTTFRPWHDRATGRTGVKVTGGKCLHSPPCHRSWMGWRGSVCRCWSSIEAGIAEDV
jgi:hypothetical protein